MTLPIYKKTIFDKMNKNKLKDISNKISETDKIEITRLMKLFNSHRDARGRWSVPEKH